MTQGKNSLSPGADNVGFDELPPPSPPAPAVKSAQNSITPGDVTPAPPVPKLASEGAEAPPASTSVIPDVSAAGGDKATVADKAPTLTDQPPVSSPTRSRLETVMQNDPTTFPESLLPDEGQLLESFEQFQRLSLNVSIPKSSAARSELVKLRVGPLPMRVEYDEIVFYRRSVREGRGGFDALFPSHQVGYVPTAKECVYHFLAPVLKKGWALMTLGMAHERGVPWHVHLLMDSDCKIAAAPNLILTHSRMYSADFLLGMYHGAKSSMFAGCDALRSGKALSEAPLELEDNREYFYCVGDYTAPGDHMVLTMGCMGRYFARYPNIDARRRVAVLFPKPTPDLAGFANTLKMFIEHIPETTFILLPHKQYIYFPPNCTIVMPSKIPTYTIAKNDFVRDVMLPRVLANFSNTLPKYRRISIVSAGHSITGRAFHSSPAWPELLQRHGFVDLPSTMPMAERIYYIHHAELMISSRGSNDAINHHLMTNDTIGEIPRLILFHSGYGGTTCGGWGVCAHHQPLFELAMGQFDNNLGRVSDAVLTEFINLASRFTSGRKMPYETHFGRTGYYP